MTKAPTPIQTNVYPVTVTVTTPASGKPTLQFTPDPVQVRQGSNALIVFNLATPNYHFPVDGSALVINSSNPSSEFPIAWIINASTLALGDYNNNVGTYKYTMTVVDSQSGVPVTTDPSIRNDQ